MTELTNNAGLSLAMAVWLAHNEYTDGSDQFDCDVISATSLLQPTRKLILSKRVPQEKQTMDVMDLYSSRHGHALHNDIEHAWKTGYKLALKRLGYPQTVIDKIRINPDPDDPDFEDTIPVFLEERHFREMDFNGERLVISGQFDMVIDGILNDTKKTSVYTYTSGSKATDYQIQGSIYRWINPTIVTSDVMHIQHIFTDWKKGDAARIQNYPPNPVHEFTVELMSLEQTERWIRAKVREILKNQDLEQDAMIRCTDKELWRSDPEYKYYSDPTKAAAGGRATRNFGSDRNAAYRHLSKQGKGIVVEKPGEVKACGYCPAQIICQQALEYRNESV